MPKIKNVSVCLLLANILFFINVSRLSATSFLENTPIELSLYEALQIIGKSGRAIQIAELRLKQSAESAKSSKELFLPSIDLKASRTLKDSNPSIPMRNPNDNFLGLSITQTLDLTGKDWDQFRSSQKQREISSKALEQTKTESYLSFIELFFSMEKQRDAISTLEEQVNRLEKLIQIIRAENKVGRKSKVDLLETEYQLEVAKIALMEGKSQMQARSVELSTLVFGFTRPVTWQPFSSRSDILNVLADSFAKLSSSGENQPLEVQLEALKLQKMNLDHTGYRSFLPTLAFSYQVGRDYSQRVNDNDQTNQDISSHEFILQANWNLFNGFSDKHRYKREKLEIREQLLQIDKTLQEAISQKTKLKQEIEKIKKVKPIRSKLIQVATANYDSANAKYKAGRITTKDVLDYQERVTNSKIEFSKLELDEIIMFAKILALENRLLATIDQVVNNNKSS